MKTGSSRSLIFTPPPSQLSEAREADQVNARAETPATEKDPQESVLLYGRMLTDIDIIDGELRSLLFSGPDYRSKLRVTRSAAQRLAARAARLLGEE